MLNTEMLLATILWPAIAAAAVLLFSQILGRWAPLALQLGPALAVLLGFMVGYWGIVGTPVYPPVDAKSGLPLVVVASLLATFITAKCLTQPIFIITTGIASGVVMWFVLKTAIQFQWSTSEAIVRVLAFAVGLFIISGAASMIQTRVSHRISLTVLAAIAGLGAPLMLFSDSLLLAQLHGALGIAAGVACIAVWVAPTRFTHPSVQFVIPALAGSLWVIALLFANLHTINFVLLSAALPCGGVALLLTRRLSQIWQNIVLLAVIASCLFTSIATGGLRYASPDAPTEQSDDDYGYGYGYDS